MPPPQMGRGIYIVLPLSVRVTLSSTDLVSATPHTVFDAGIRNVQGD